MGLAFSWVISILLTYSLLLYRITTILPIKMVQMIISIKEGLIGASRMALLLYVSGLFIEENLLLALLCLILIGGCSYSVYIFYGIKRL